MKQNTYTVIENSRIATDVFLMRLELSQGSHNPQDAGGVIGNRIEPQGQMAPYGNPHDLVRGGQFVDVALEGKFLRRPFAASWWDDKGLALVYKVVGEGTKEMAGIGSGATLSLLTGLGNGFDAGKARQNALVVTGGLGASPAFSLVKELKAQNKNVTLIMGFNRAEDIVLEDEYRALGVDPIIVTLDGSKGLKGLVTDAIAAVGYGRKQTDGQEQATAGKNACGQEQTQVHWDYFYTCGPKVMMKAVCTMMDIPGEASLEERMGCGCGICYGCTCHTTDGPRRICADGPVFPKYKIIW